MNLNEEQLNNIKDVGTLMLATAKNIEENENIFIHVFKEDENDPEWSIQYKMNCKATIETTGELFEEIKHYEETEVLPEGFYVSGIIIANIIDCKEYVG